MSKSALASDKVVQVDRNEQSGITSQKMERLWTSNMIATLKEERGVARLDPAKIRWVDDRWRGAVLNMSRKTRWAQRAFLWSRFLTVAGALTIPVLAGINVAGKSSNAIQLSTLILSLVVAIATAVDQVFRLGQRWRLSRQTRGDLVAEGWDFFEGAGPYKRGHAATFQHFFEQIEKILKFYESHYLVDVAVLPSTNTPDQTSPPSQG
jgi:hypothetical protein